MKENLDLYQFYKELTKLKHIERKGWLDNKVNIDGRVESDAEHTFSLAIISMLMNDYLNLNLNPEKLLRLALIHEIGEIDAGDITWYDDKIKDKSVLEKNCINRVFSILQEPIKSNYINLWREYETQSSPEAKFIKKMDKIDCLLQAKCYDKVNGTNIFEKFYKHDKPMIEEFEQFINQTNKKPRN